MVKMDGLKLCARGCVAGFALLTSGVAASFANAHTEDGKEGVSPVHCFKAWRAEVLPHLRQTGEREANLLLRRRPLIPEELRTRTWFGTGPSEVGPLDPTTAFVMAVKKRLGVKGGAARFQFEASAEGITVIVVRLEHWAWAREILDLADGYGVAVRLDGWDQPE